MSRNWSYSSLSILLLFICLIAVNVVAYYLPMRADMTAEKLYTISEGSRSILSGLKDPLRIKYYFSASSEELPPYIKNYAERVREVLEEYENLSSGRITLETFDPKPDTEEEEWAERYGINAVTLPQGSRLYFGAVVLMLDQEMTLPFFDPRRERFLEYDLTQAIYKVSQTERPKIGILSTLNLSGGRSMIPGQRPAEKWVFLGEMEKTMEVVNLPLDTEEIADDIGLLLVMHPKEFSDSLVYAIDQFVLRGGKTIVMVDPNGRADLASPMNQMGRQPQIASNLPKLFEKWGVDYDVSKVSGDPTFGTPVNTGSGVMRFPMWMSFNAQALDQTHPVTSQLENVLFVEAGALSKAKDSKHEYTPLLSLSDKSGILDAFMLRFVQPNQISRDLKPDNQSKSLIARVSGKFETAFPEGRPPAEKKEGEEQPEPQQPLNHDHLNAAQEATSVMVFSDIDFISDDFSVQKMNFLGQRIIQPANDNLNLMLNAVEHLSGNEALMSIRSRGQSARPFTRLEVMQVEAQMKFQDEESRLQETLKQVQNQLDTLLESAGKKGETEVILPPEMQAEIKRFRGEERQTRKKLREV
ncbi:MAG: GldG family protein, partial [SAR324 cluster bacterium]|nr:GldG family protein [SAR324 cluster bacterium]